MPPPLDDLCALIQATLHARKGKALAEEHSEPEQPGDPEGEEIQAADNIMDVDLDDGARHLADIDDGKSPPSWHFPPQLVI